MNRNKTSDMTVLRIVTGYNRMFFCTDIQVIQLKMSILSTDLSTVLRCLKSPSKESDYSKKSYL